MGLNIKNAETHRLVQELADLTGESLTAAVTEAVKERLGRIKRQHGTSLSGRLMAIGQDCAAHMREPYRSIDHGAMLYGDDGLPA